MTGKKKEERGDFVSRISRLRKSAPIRLPNGSVLYPASYDIEDGPFTIGTYHHSVPGDQPVSHDEDEPSEDTGEE